MPTRRASKLDFKRAMAVLGKPGGRQLGFLQEHFSAPGRASTAGNLARAAGYQNYRAINLHYGGLAKRIAGVLGIKGVGIELLVEGNEPLRITNEHWVLSMRPEFADALSELGWVK